MPSDAARSQASGRGADATFMISTARVQRAEKAAAGRRTATAKRRRRARLGWLAAGILLLSPAVGWYVIHSVPAAGPLVANALRAVIGVQNVTRLEEFAYEVEDRVNRSLRSDQAPKAYWTVPSTVPQDAASSPTPAKTADAQPDPVQLPEFHPPDVGPVHQSWFAPGDGKWVRIVDPRRPNEPAYMYKTLLHPDRNRSWAEVFVVAVDLRRARLYVVPGYREPKATEPVPEDFPRPAKIPEQHHEELLAAFNGGFMTEHGSYGMKIRGVTLVKPKDSACTVAMYQDGSLRIGSWRKLKQTEPRMRWYRQAPNCMYEDGKMHPLLALQNVRKWGATLDGNTVIRRSAIGLDKTRQVLFVAITNHTTAQVLAEGMHHAGAQDVAQLDVNWSYPKFVLFEPDASGKRKAVALADGFEFSSDEYIRKRSLRDFFYLVRKNPE